jgi:hypothetical protein
MAKKMDWLDSSVNPKAGSQSLRSNSGLNPGNISALQDGEIASGQTRMAARRCQHWR